MQGDIELRLVSTLIDNFGGAYKHIDGLSSVMFTDKTTKTLFESVMELKEEGEKIDLVNVGRVSGMPVYDLTEYLDKTFPSVESVEHDCGYIIKSWQGREITRTLKQYSLNDSDPSELTDEVILKLKDIINQTAGQLREFRDDVQDWREAYQDEFDGLKESGINCGYGFIDSLTRGYKPGNLIIIGARTGVGKTTFALNQAVKIAERGDPVGVISMEMTQRELIDKILGIKGNITQDEIHAQRKPEVLNRIIGETVKIEGLPLYLNAPKSDDPNKIFNIIKQMVYKRGVKAVFLDYLQLMSYPQQSQNRNYEIGKITRKLKMLAGELGIPIIVLSQLKRKDGNPPPVLSDLRDSGSIEQDANVVMFLHQAEDDVEGVFDVDIDCILAKNRGGGKGFRTMLFRKSISGIYAKEDF